MTEPAIPITAEDVDHDFECNDDPKLTAEEWAYVEAISTGGEG